MAKSYPNISADGIVLPKKTATVTGNGAAVTATPRERKMGNLNQVQALIYHWRARRD
jgi:hypothetical protein